MAHALAAVCPPLKPSDVRQVAEELVALDDKALVIHIMQELGADLVQARRIVEVLGALLILSGWLLTGR